MEFYHVFNGDKELVGNAYILRGQNIEEAYLVPGVQLGGSSQQGHGSYRPPSGAFENNNFLKIGQSFNQRKEGKLMSVDQRTEVRCWRDDEGKVEEMEDYRDVVSLESCGNNDLETEDTLSKGYGDSETVSNVEDVIVRGDNASAGDDCDQAGDHLDFSLLLAPFNLGWQREVVTNQNKQVITVYYLPPGKLGKGSRVRTWKEVASVLSGCEGLTFANFSFDKVVLGLGPEREIIRESSRGTYYSERANLLELSKDRLAVESLPHPPTICKYWQYFKVLKPGSKGGRVHCLLCGEKCVVVSYSNMARHVNTKHPHHQSEAKNMGLHVTKNNPLYQSVGSKLPVQLKTDNPLHQPETRNIGHQIAKKSDDRKLSQQASNDYSLLQSDARKSRITNNHQLHIKNSMGFHVPVQEKKNSPRKEGHHMVRNLSNATNMSGHVAKNPPLHQQGKNKTFYTLPNPRYTKLRDQQCRRNDEATLDIVKESSETETEKKSFVERGATDENSNFSVDTEDTFINEKAIPDVVSESLVGHSEENTEGESSCDSSVQVGFTDRRTVPVTFMMDSSNRLRMEVKSKVKLMKLMVMFGGRFGLDLSELRFINRDIGIEIELTGEEKVGDLKSGFVSVEKLFSSPSNLKLSS